MKGKFASYLFKHPSFPDGVSGIKAALTDVIARMETELIDGACYYFSVGCWMCNVLRCNLFVYTCSMSTFVVIY